jgi:large subunit GTPase 1
MLLLNKADLLPLDVRKQWADYFDAQGICYVFWSAVLATERRKKEAAMGATGPDSEVQLLEGSQEAEPPANSDPRVRILDDVELTELLTREAVAAVETKDACQPQAACPEAAMGGASHAQGDNDDTAESSVQPTLAPPTVGLIGFPNVGKSSTINALYGSKKTAVAATPGKTKHFQTLFVTPTLRLCDCPGLVLPRLASSVAEMVAAGVVPIDRLTDVTAAVSAVAQRVSRQQLRAVLKISLPRPQPHEDQHRAPTAREVICAYAVNRGWLNGSGLPDETRASRSLLKDNTAGKLVYCEWPPGAQRACPWDEGLGVYTSQQHLLQFTDGV